MVTQSVLVAVSTQIVGTSILDLLALLDDYDINICMLNCEKKIINFISIKKKAYLTG